MPGEAFIDPLETAGLPLSSRQTSGDSQMSADGHAGRVEHLATREAAGVVRAHTKRWGILRRRRHRSTSRAPADQDNEKTHTHRLRSSRAVRGTTTEYESEESEFEHPYLVQNQSKHKEKPKKSWWQFHTPPSVAHPPQDTASYDLESRSPSRTNQPKLGTGVLSALLALYGHDHDHEHQSESGTWSLRTSEDEGDLSGPDQPWLESKGKHKKSTSVGRTLHSASASASSLLASFPSVPPALIPPALKSKEKAPATTAALVAGAGALVGAAVPQQTGLAPDLKRGYGLVRYKFEDGPSFDLTPSTSASKAPPVPPPTAVLAQEPWGPSPGLVGEERTPPRLHLPRRTKSTDFDFTRGVGGTVKEDHEGEAAASARIVVDDGDESPDTLGGTTTTAADSPASGMGLLRPDMNMTPASTLHEGKKSKRWTGVLKDMPLPLHGMHLKGFSLSMPGTPNRQPASGASTPGGTQKSSSGVVTPDEKMNGDYFGAKWMEEQKERERKERKDKERREKEKRRKRKKAEVYVCLSLVPRTLFYSCFLPSQITRHVAAILQRQEFISKLARAMMMFGGPSHRLVAQIQSTARVLELELSCMYLPDVLWISFEDSATGTSNVKFIRQGSALDLGKLGEAHGLYWDVRLCVHIGIERY